MSALLRGLAALLLVLLALAAAGWFAARPWLAPPSAAPEHVAGTWSRVEAWAAETRQANAPIDGLYAALGPLGRAEARDEAWEPTRPPEPASDPATQQALAALAEWGRSGGLGDELCIVDPADLSAGPPRTVEMFRLARLAFQHGRDDGDPAFAAALRLGAYLRSRGPLLAGAVGFAIARDALQVAEARNLPAGPAFMAFAPRREEVLPILAREAVCSLRLAEAALRSGASGSHEPRRSRRRRPLVDRMGRPRARAGDGALVPRRAGRRGRGRRRRPHRRGRDPDSPGRARCPSGQPAGALAGGQRRHGCGRHASHPRRLRRAPRPAALSCPRGHAFGEMRDRACLPEHALEDMSHASPPARSLGRGHPRRARGGRGARRDARPPQPRGRTATNSGPSSVSRAWARKPASSSMPSHSPRLNSP
ncbi:hypothetical protein [Nannocystis pusilla]|uniref:hypothetical protein n=1 Tax=Nannocystis pusilla TaxID=889268 RepID=UPI003DA450A8